MKEELPRPGPPSRQEARSSSVVRLRSLSRYPRHAPSLLTPALSWLSGCPPEGETQRCRNTFGAFQGCMRLLSIDGQPVDFMMVQQRLLGNYSQLQIDVCGITDRSETPRSSPPLRFHHTFFIHHSWIYALTARPPCFGWCVLHQSAQLEKQPGV